MISWVWIPVSMMIGVFAGIFLISFAEVSREEDKRNERKWWGNDRRE